jgi:hypothetical protein
MEASDLQTVAAETAASAADEEPAEETAAAEDTKSEKRRRLAAFFRGEGAALSSGKRDSRRYFEIGLLDLNLGLGGIGIDKFFDGDFFDFDSLDMERASGFTGDIRLFTNPVYFKVSVKDVFVLDFFTGAEMNVYVNLPKNTIETLDGIMKKANEPPPTYTGGTPTQEQITEYQKQLAAYIDGLAGADATMTAGAGAFIELGIGGSKTVLNDRLWIRAAPALFFTLLHMKNNNVKLTGYKNDAAKKYGLQGSGSMKLYSAWDLDNEANPFASPGVDLTLEASYALWSVLDAGITVSHIPIIPSTLTHSKSLDASKITMTVDGDLEKIINSPDSAADFNVPDLYSIFEDSNDESERVIRPVRFDFYTLYKPFKSPVLIVKPNIGATLNTAVGDAMLNWGINIRYNAPVIFSIFIGTGLIEGMWTNSAGMSLDFRVFEVDLGAALAASDFAGSFSPKNGLMAAIGFKIGF